METTGFGRFAKLGMGLTVLAALVLAGCGGGGGGGAAGGAAGVNVNVVPALGQFELGATVRVRDRNLNQIAVGTVNASGVAAVTIPAGALTPLLIEAGINGDKYFDEKLGTQTIATSSVAAVRALVTSYTAGGNIGVTPLTEIAVGALTNTSGVLPVGIAAASAVAANTSVAQAFGVSSVLTAPTLVNSVSGVAALGTSEADQYAVALAGLANMALTGEDALKVAHRLRDDLKKPAPTVALNQVITDLNTAITNLNTTTGAPKVMRTVPNAQTVLVDLQAAAHQAMAALTGANANVALAALEAAAKNNVFFYTEDLRLGVALATAKANAANVAVAPVPVVVPPSVTSFSPTSGVATNATSGVVGTTVVITGTNFNPVAANNTVRFAGTPATVTTASATSLTVTVPAGAKTGGITVMDNATFGTGTAVGQVFTVSGTTAPTTLYTITVKVQTPSVPTLSTVATIPNWPALPVDQATFCKDTTPQINAMMGGAVFTRTSCTFTNNVGTVVLAARSGNFTFQFGFAQQAAAFTCPAGQVRTATGCSPTQIYTVVVTVSVLGVPITTYTDYNQLMPTTAQFCANADTIAASGTPPDTVLSCTLAGSTGTVVMRIPAGDPQLPAGGDATLSYQFTAQTAVIPAWFLNANGTINGGGTVSITDGNAPPVGPAPDAAAVTARINSSYPSATGITITPTINTATQKSFSVSFTASTGGATTGNYVMIFDYTLI